MAEFISSEHDPVIFDGKTLKNRFSDFIQKYQIMAKENVNYMEEIAQSQKQIEALRIEVDELEKQNRDKTDAEVDSLHWNEERFVKIVVLVTSFCTVPIKNC